MRKTDKAAEIAAAEYPLPDQWSTGDEDTWNGYKRRSLERRIRAAIKAERTRCVRVIEACMDRLDIKKQPAEVATCWALLDILAPARTIKPKKKARKRE